MFRERVRAVDLGGRVPPANVEAEQAVLSTVLCDGRAFDEVLEFLVADHFYSDANKRIFEAAEELHRKGTPVDVQTVAAFLKDRDRLQAIGGISYLARLVDATPAVAHVVAHAKIVKEKARMRRLIETCQMVAAEGYGDYGEAQDFIDQAEQAIYAIAHEHTQSEGPVQAYDLMADAFKRTQEHIDRVARGEKAVLGVATGFDDVDAKTTGLRDGELIIVAARPGMGKGHRAHDRVLTPHGWRCVGDLSVGDELVGSDGRPTRVKALFDRGVLDVFRVTMDDGVSVVCDADHLWLTRTRGERLDGATGRVRETRAIASTLRRADSGGLNHSLAYVAPVHFAARGERPLPAYLLGVLLGDGNPESDIRERVRSLLPLGDDLRADYPDSVYIAGGATMSALRSLQLDGCRAWEKFIPEEYLYAPIEERIELLRGLCDTDGFVTTPGRRSVEFCTASDRLADDVEFLVRSLGGTISKRVRPTFYVTGGKRHEARPSWRMVLSFPTGDIVPVSSKKHLAKWQHGPHRVTERFIKSVEPEGRARVICLSVEAHDEQYVAAGFVVTHNTSYALDIARNVAAEIPPTGEDGQPVSPRLGVIVFSLEMPKAQIADRMIASAGRVELTSIRKPETIQRETWNRYVEATNELAKLPVWVDDTPAISVLAMRAKIRRKQAEFDKRVGEGEAARFVQRIGLVVVDYLQLMRGREGAQSREAEIESVSQDLKALAKELRVPVVALAQLNRECETRDKKNKRPQLSDLRGSGAIEQDADVVQFIYRPEYYIDDKSSDEAQKLRGYAEVIIAKQRNGPTGRVPVTWFENFTRFENRAREAWRAEDD